jgi:hypothetical protein
MTALTFTMADGTAVDLTDPAVNPDAAPQSTPRQGGFTLRNRWDASKLAATGDDVSFAAGGVVHVTSAAAATFTVTPFTVLDVPARTMVRDISLYGVHGQTDPDHAIYYSGNAASSAHTASDIKSATLTFHAAAWGKDDGTSVATHVDGFGEIDLTATGAAAGNGSIVGSVLNCSWTTSSNSSISTPTRAGVVLENTMASLANAATSFRTPMYFPHGGKVVMKIKDAASGRDKTSASGDVNLAALSGKITGVWEIGAQCNYVPV